VFNFNLIKGNSEHTPTPTLQKLPNIFDAPAYRDQAEPMPPMSWQVEEPPSPTAGKIRFCFVLPTTAATCLVLSCLRLLLSSCFEPFLTGQHPNFYIRLHMGLGLGSGLRSKADSGSGSGSGAGLIFRPSGPRHPQIANCIAGKLSRTY